jgi:hypothetical protein
MTRAYRSLFQDLMNVWTMPVTMFKNKVMYYVLAIHSQCHFCKLKMLYMFKTFVSLLSGHASYKVTDSSCPINYWFLTRDNKMSVSALLLMVAETLHKLEQKWEIIKVTVHSFIDSSQELLGMPSCVKYSVLRHLVTISKQSNTMYDACFLIYLMTLPQLCVFMMSNDCKS